MMSRTRGDFENMCSWSAFKRITDVDLGFARLQHNMGIYDHTLLMIAMDYKTILIIL